ncbi:hypothetical protein T4C_14104 [Trichinella pseudospiralis]|uniref:Uncharacterized protein n=1 Tax=Trichinella pseudospiralis TaxID=6337 RepID=A0A0V1K730_TRIPS|nr:hypothetical protein T4C_14104 [Trichinella pseudospiralis]
MVLNYRHLSAYCLKGMSTVFVTNGSASLLTSIRNLPTFNFFEISLEKVSIFSADAMMFLMLELDVNNE